jgi:hypothetical protein
MGRANVLEGTGPLRLEREHQDGTRLGRYFSSLLGLLLNQVERWFGTDRQGRADRGLLQQDQGSVKMVR